MKTNRPNADARLAELLIYVAEATEKELSFGALKMNKVLFYADFLAFLNLGRSITGQNYQKLKLGPAPRRMIPVRNTLISKKAIELKENPVSQEMRVRPQRKADLSHFTGDEIALVHQVLDECRGYSGTDLSDLSHRFLGWEAARMGETIPYSTAFFTVVVPHDDEKEHARTLLPTAKKLVALAA